MAIIKTQFTMRLDPVTHVKIKKIAEKENRSLTNMIEHIIKTEIARFEAENGEISITEEEIYG